MDKSDIIFLNHNNIQLYKSALSCINLQFGFHYSNEDASIKISVEERELLDKLKYEYLKMRRILKNSELDFTKHNNITVLIAYNNDISQNIIKNLPVFACTFPDKNKVYCFIACIKSQLIFQVFVHELVHALRLCKLNILTFRDYIIYNNNPINLFFEEIIASAFEKYFFQKCSWEEVLGFKYKEINYEEISNLKNIILERNLNRETLVNILMRTDKTIAIFFLCTYLNLEQNVFDFLSVSTNQGVNYLCDCLHAFN